MIDADHQGLPAAFKTPGVAADIEPAAADRPNHPIRLLEDFVEPLDHPHQGLHHPVMFRTFFDLDSHIADRNLFRRHRGLIGGFDQHVQALADFIELSPVQFGKPIGNIAGGKAAEISHDRPDRGNDDSLDAEKEDQKKQAVQDDKGDEHGDEVMLQFLPDKLHRQEDVNGPQFFARPRFLVCFGNFLPAFDEIVDWDFPFDTDTLPLPVADPAKEEVSRRISDINGNYLFFFHCCPKNAVGGVEIVIP